MGPAKCSKCGVYAGEFAHDCKPIKDYTNRANVVKYLDYWKEYLAKHGPDKTFEWLNKSRTIMLNRKDELGLIQALGLSAKLNKADNGRIS